MKKLAIAVLVAASQWCGSAAADTIHGTIEWSPAYAEAFVSDNFQYPNGNAFSTGPTTLICIDVETPTPLDYTQVSGDVSYRTGVGAAAIRGPGGIKSVAAIHWLIDEYYETYFTSGTDVQQWAFQYVLWEIGNDYDGTVGSIDPDAGLSWPSSDPYFSHDPVFVDAYTTMYDGLISRVPTLPDSYVATKYDVDLVEFPTNPKDYQSMVAVYKRAPGGGGSGSGSLVAVPIDVSVGVLGGGILALAVRARRQSASRSRG